MLWQLLCGCSLFHIVFIKTAEFLRLWGEVRRTSINYLFFLSITHETHQMIHFMYVFNRCRQVYTVQPWENPAQTDVDQVAHEPGASWSGYASLVTGTMARGHDIHQDINRKQLENSWSLPVMVTCGVHHCLTSVVTENTNRSEVRTIHEFMPQALLWWSGSTANKAHLSALHIMGSHLTNLLAEHKESWKNHFLLPVPTSQFLQTSLQLII